MNVPLQDLNRQNGALAADFLTAFRTVIESGRFVLGREVLNFETEFAAAVGARHCVANANGTDALELALRAVGVDKDDEVVLAANAGMYATVAVLAMGALPVFGEIDPQRYSLDPNRLAENLTERTRAVVLTHLYGCAGYVEEIVSLCRSAGIPVIEDCAQAHGAAVKGRAVGTWGKVGCFSFYPTKNLGALGDGGACVTDDGDVADRLRILRQYGWKTKYHAEISGGRNSRLDEIQAALLRRKLPYLRGWNDRRREIARKYNDAFAQLSLQLPEMGNDPYVAHLYVVRVKQQRETFMRSLQSKGVCSAVHFPVPDYQQPAVAHRLHKSWVLPETERACTEVVTLPCFPEMTDIEVEYVIDVVTTTMPRLFN